jgi:plasmid stabilization system protein ParE
MAKIKWHDEATMQLKNHISYALEEYGKSTALRWKKEVTAFEERVRLFPESYTPEEHLRGLPVLYRRRHLMNHRFKLIYYYDETEDTVHIVDIWDTRMKPETLIKRINNV